MKRLFVLGAVALACSQAWGLGVEISNTGTAETRNERSHDNSNKTATSAGIIVLRDSALAAVVPIDRAYLQAAWYYGGLRVPVDRQADKRLGIDPAFYAEQRAERLALSDDPVARVVGGLYQQCQGNEACIKSIAVREALAQMVQSPGFTQQRIWLVTERPGVALEGYRLISDKDWDNYWIGAVTATVASSVTASYLADAVPAGGMSLAQRRFELGKAFFTMPDDVVMAALPAARWTPNVPWWKEDSPLEFSVDGLGTFHIDQSGVTVTQSGAVRYGQGNIVDGKKIDYTDEATGSVKSSASRSNSKATATKRVKVN